MANKAEHSAAYYQANKAKVLDRSAAWYRANKKKVAERSAAWYHANKLKIDRREAAYRQANKERIARKAAEYYQANKAKMSKQAAEYRQLHPEIMKLHDGRRRARLASVPRTLTKQDVLELYAIQKGLCHWCKKSYGKPHLDHVVPISKGGANSKKNVVLACATCNLRKNDKMPEEWMKLVAA